MTVLEKNLVVRRGEEKTLVVERLGPLMRVVLEEGARLHFVFVATKGWEEPGEGGDSARCARVEFEFVGSNSELQFFGFVVGRDAEKFIFETVSLQRVPQTKAHFHLKAAMYGGAMLDYTGTLKIEKAAQLADAYLASHTLLLSDKARARTIPALEIEADDVKAGHAATIGKIDKELMFYLKSRGISGEEAEKMLVGGFFAAQLEMISDEKVREDVRSTLVEALPFALF